MGKIIKELSWLSRRWLGTYVAVLVLGETIKYCTHSYPDSWPFSTLEDASARCKFPRNYRNLLWSEGRAFLTETKNSCCVSVLYVQAVKKLTVNIQNQSIYKIAGRAVRLTFRYREMDTGLIYFLSWEPYGILFTIAKFKKKHHDFN